MYYIEVNCQVKKECNCCKNNTIKYEWLKLKPTNGEPYKYNTEAEAVRIAEICYGDFTDDVRVIKE